MLPQQGETGDFQRSGNRLFLQSGYRFAQLAGIISSLRRNYHRTAITSQVNFTTLLRFFSFSQSSRSYLLCHA
jgi:hypothetical protein